MKIGLLGYGTVGKGFKEIIDKDDNYEVNKILVKNKREDDIFVYSFEGFLDDIDVVVEALNGEEPAYSYALETLNRGIPYITANKKMIARHLDLFDLAKKNNTHLMAEASVCGGIPLFSNINRIRKTDEIENISGIMNGTCNYILSSIFNEIISFEEALESAKEKGYAEADPSDDIKGYDTRYKLCISMLKAFDYKCNVDDIPCFGIDNVNNSDIEYARNNGYVIKLLAKADRNKNAVVIPAFIRKDSIFYNINTNYNCASIISNHLGKFNLIGQGAGSLPTGFALAQDLYELENDTYHEYREINISNDIKHQYYIRTDNTDKYNGYIYERINENSFISKKISFDEVIKNIHIDFIGEIEDD